MPRSLLRALRTLTDRPRPSVRQRRFRQLIAQQLEKRLQLTAVTSVSPTENTSVAPLNADISATFDADIAPATATFDTFVVNRTNTGELSDATATISTTGPTVTVNPGTDFFPGEVVRVTATSGIQSTAAQANDARIWEFRAEVNSGSGQFVDSGTRVGTNQDGEVGFADLDGDGDIDVVQGGNLVWINDGNASFTSNGQTLNAGTNWDLGDIDGDGDADVAGQNNVFLNDGNANFTATGQDLSPGVGGQSVELGDLDGDGDLDAMVGVAYSGNLVFLNDGTGNFTNTGQSLGTSNSEGLGFGDFDNDGDLDAFVANNGPPDRVYFNDGNGNFTDSLQSLGGFAGSSSIEIADIDNDGDLDSIVANAEDGGPGSSVWLNDGTGVFTDTGQRMNSGTNNPDLAVGDVDADGDLDLYIAGAYQNPELWLNDGAGIFQEAASFPFPGQRPNWAGMADLDGDGDLDVFEANRFGEGSRIFINQNLEPSVTLSVDATAVAEGGGVATVTATLSAAHSQPVTIDLTTSGTATEGDDYTLSGTQIVVAVGQTSGTVTVTAVQDAVDEPDETVNVEISDVTNGSESGAQQVTVTINDDDEPLPNVSLTVDNASIPEAGGVATFTATLSAVSATPVTVDLAISGTASAEDFTASATQIVIPGGATSGSITVTATQDDGDEPDETVVVDIAAVTGALESGVQQATTTIADDDEPVAPDVTLTVDNPSIPEAAGTATLTITLSEATTAPVTVDLAVSGTATAVSDYTISATQVVFEVGTTTQDVTVVAVQDEVSDPNETVVVDIAAVAGGNELGDQQQTVTIADDDLPPTFMVTSLTSTNSGFVLELNNQLDTADINLYDTENAGLGAADVTLVGATSGPVVGSLVASGTSVAFVATGGPLAADTYTVTLRSGTDAFEDVSGQLLDGNGDGTAGDNYSSEFTIAPPEGAREVSIPDFMRGPGQDVNLPADETTGIPITLSDGAGVLAVDIRIAYDPTMLEITGASAPAGGTVVLNTTAVPGVAILVFFSSVSLPAGPLTLINLEANVPADNASGIYGEQQVLELMDVVVGDGNDNEFPAVADDGVHLASYFGDASGNGRINASDAAQVARFAALIDTGFAASLNTDPNLIGDITGNGRINAADASRVAQFAALIPVPEIPPVPGGIVINAAGSSNQLPSSILVGAPQEASIGSQAETDSRTSSRSSSVNPEASVWTQQDERLELEELDAPQEFDSEAFDRALDELVDDLTDDFNFGTF